MTDETTKALLPCPPCPICRADATWETALTANVGGKEVIYGSCSECSCTAEYHDWLAHSLPSQASDAGEVDTAVGRRMMVMVPRPVGLVITDADKQAACDLIGRDTYGKPIWTIDTISPENRVVQAFARHRLAHSLPSQADETSGEEMLLREENARLRAHIAASANSINAAGSAYDEAIAALDRLVAETKSSARAALTKGAE